MSTTGKATSSWSFRLSSHRSTSSSESSSDEPSEEPSATALAQELDLSTRDEPSVTFRKDPWSVAKLNAAVKRKGDDGGNGQVAVHDKKTRVVEGKSGGPIERAFKRQALLPKPPLTQQQQKPHGSSHPNSQPDSSGISAPFFAQAQKTKPTLLKSKAGVSRSDSRLPPNHDCVSRQPSSQPVLRSSSSVSFVPSPARSPLSDFRAGIRSSLYVPSSLPEMTSSLGASRLKPPESLGTQQAGVAASPIARPSNLSSSHSSQRSHPMAIPSALPTPYPFADISSTRNESYFPPSSPSPSSVTRYSTPSMKGTSVPTSVPVIPRPASPLLAPMYQYSRVSTPSSYMSSRPPSTLQAPPASVSRVRELLHNVINFPAEAASAHFESEWNEESAEYASLTQHPQYSNRPGAPSSSMNVHSSPYPASSGQPQRTVPPASLRPATLSPATKRAISQAARPAASRSRPMSPRPRPRIKLPSPSPSPPPAKRARAVVPSSHPDLAAPEIWSTLPTRKRKAPAKVVQSGRFRLPQLFNKDEGVVVKKEEPKSVGIGFRPPPRIAKQEESTDTGSTGWKLTLLGSTHDLGRPSSSKKESSAKSSSAARPSDPHRFPKRFEEVDAEQSQRKPPRETRQHKLQSLYDAFEDSDNEAPQITDDSHERYPPESDRKSDETAVDRSKPHATSETLCDEDVLVADTALSDEKTPGISVDVALPQFNTVPITLSRLSERYPLTREVISRRERLYKNLPLTLGLESAGPIWRDDEADGGREVKVVGRGGWANGTSGVSSSL